MFLNYFEDHYTKTRFLYFKLFFYRYYLIDVFKLKFSNVDHQTIIETSKFVFLICTCFLQFTGIVDLIFSLFLEDLLCPTIIKCKYLLGLILSLLWYKFKIAALLMTFSSQPAESISPHIYAMAQLS